MRIFFYACAMAALCVPVYGQQLLCDYTAEADAADIDGLELLMGDPLNSCEGYSVSFTDFLNAIQVTGIDAVAIDADGDAVSEVSVASSTVNFDPDDDGVAEASVGSSGELIAGNGTAASPGFKFSDNTGIYNQSTNIMSFSLSGVRYFQLRREDPGTVTIQGTNNHTGDKLCADSSGFACVTLTAGNGPSLGSGPVTVEDILKITPKATAPATCSIGDFYVDTSGAACACSSTNTWTNMHGVGSCT